MHSYSNENSRNVPNKRRSSDYPQDGRDVQKITRELKQWTINTHVSQNTILIAHEVCQNVVNSQISQIIVPYLIYLICLNSLKELSKSASLNIYLITISSTLSSQPTSKVIPLKLLYCLSMTTSSKL